MTERISRQSEDIVNVLDFLVWSAVDQMIYGAVRAEAALESVLRLIGLKIDHLYTIYKVPKPKNGDMNVHHFINALREKNDWEF